MFVYPFCITSGLREIPIPTSPYFGISANTVLPEPDMAAYTAPAS